MDCQSQAVNFAESDQLGLSSIRGLSEYKPIVTHEGSRIFITTKLTYDREGVLIEFRDSFLLRASDRVSPIHALLSEEGLRAGTVTGIKELGLYVRFEAIAEPGNYFLDIRPSDLSLCKIN